MHAMYNPGSVYQAFALQKYLTDNSYETKIIDYTPSYFYDEGRKLKLIIKKVFYRKLYKSREKKFEKFIKENMSLTKNYVNYKELIDDNLVADCFIVGSDQLWNTDYKCGSDLAYYLEFTDSTNKISYSTSVGKKYINESNRKMLLDHLKKFKKISVRESSTANLLSDLLDRPVEFVCDPVFLLKKEDYLKFIIDDFCKDKYIVIYMSPKNDVLDNVVEYYKKKGYKIYLIGGFTRRCYCDYHFKDVGPREFLTFIYNAELVISTSFHATSFSIIFNKSFLVILPKNNSERIESLLNEIKLSDRIITETTNYDKLLEIDWKRTNELLSKYIDTSKQFLKDALDEKKID